MSVRVLVLAWFLALACSGGWAADLTVGNYTLVSSRRVSTTDFEYVYRAQVTNTGSALRNVVGTVVSNSPATTIIEGTLSFGDVANGATATSVDTATFRHNRSQPFDLSKLVWTVSGTPAAPIRSDFTITPPSGNAPIDIRFTPTPTTNAAINRFEWDFDGNGTVDVTDTVGRDQVRRYTTPGTFAVSLKITDSQGRTDTRVKNLVIGNALPVVSASANPTNGQVPLTVSFSASATDSDGIARFEWDFEGDGIWDRTINGTSGNTQFVYSSVGNFTPRVRVTDNRGASVLVSVPTMEVRAAPVGSPQARLNLSRSSGPAPLSVTLSATVTDPQGRTVQRYQWDPDGNGVFDADTGTTASFPYAYASAGTYYPRVRITMVDGRQADDVRQVTATSTVSLSLNTDTLDAQLAQNVSITTVLSAATRASVVVETRNGALVRTLFPLTSRAAGTFNDTWDGKDDAGQFVAEGIYKVVLLYEVNGEILRLDRSTNTGGAEYNPPRTTIPSTFEPYNNRPLTIDFTLNRASEVTAFMGSFNVDTRYVTFYTRQPFGRGTHRITWNGDNAQGQIIKPGPGDQFLFGIWGYTLPDNGVFVRNGVQLSAMTSFPPIFDPAGLTPAGLPINCAVTFNLSLPATAELVVQDAISGVVVTRLQYPNLAGGTNTINWDGKTSDGRYVAPGTYRLGLTAIQANGFRSLSSFVLQRVFY
jgi:PKD repeat protein/flagellar hook assembly protein FlgD